MNHSLLRLHCIVFLALLCLPGCEKLPYEVAPVSGIVTLDGEPLGGATINCQPIAGKGAMSPGPGSFAVTDETGAYSLELVNPAKPGAVVGRHRVSISKVEQSYAEGREDAPDLVRTALPPAARDGSLTLTVPAEGTESADFALTSR